MFSSFPFHSFSLILFTLISTFFSCNLFSNSLSGLHLYFSLIHSLSLALLPSLSSPLLSCPLFLLPCPLYISTNLTLISTVLFHPSLVHITHECVVVCYLVYNNISINVSNILLFADNSDTTTDVIE